MVDKLDKKDIMILWELFQNSRATLASIAKKVKIPKQTVSYRMEQLMERGILNKTFSIVDMSQFNFLFYEVYIKLHNIPKEKETKALEKIKKHPYLGWLVALSGRFDFHCAIFVRRPSQFHETFYEIKSLFHPYIKELAINVTIDGKQFNYPFFKDLKLKVTETKTSKQSEDAPKLNKTQLKLLKILSENSRTPVIDIAHKLKTTEKTVSTYIKQLEKDGIILKHSCLLHPGRIGYFFYLITIRLNTPNKELEEYLAKIPEIFYIVRGAGFCDIKAEFYTETEQRAHDIKDELQEKFGKHIVEIEAMPVKKEYLVRYFTEA